MNKSIRVSKKGILLAAVFVLLLFQNALAEQIGVFSLFDEIFALFGLLFLLYGVLKTGKLRLRRSILRMIAPLTIFFGVGLLGNILYRYQTVSLVCVDVFTNAKFFLAILAGYDLVRCFGQERVHRTFLSCARGGVTVLFVLLILDYTFRVFPSKEQRYGLRTVQLFYGHATYLAGAVVFLLMVLMLFYEAKNLPYMVMGLLTLASTLRGKAIAGAAVYVLIFFFMIRYKKRLKLWHILLIGLVAVAIAWEQITFYYLDLSGRSARSVLTQTAFQILQDYFPIGTGFGTYASHAAAVNYSPVYVKYGFLNVDELSGFGFYDDTFWPIILGQTGVFGTVCYLLALLALFRQVSRRRGTDLCAYAAGVYAFAYLMISSTSEPAFNNAISIPLAAMLGYILSLEPADRPVGRPENHERREKL